MNLKKAEGTLTPKGWFKEYLRRDAEGLTGHLDDVFPQCGADIFGKDKVVHLEDGYWSSWWNGEIRGNWMEGFVSMAYISRDARLIQKARTLVNGLLDSQEEDGYIGIYQKGHRYIVTKRFGELWTQSRALRTLLCYYRHTHEERVMTAMLRMADNILANMHGSLFEQADEDGSKGHSLMIIDGFYRLYQYTHKEAYKQFCVDLYEDYSRYPSEFFQDDLRLVNVNDPDKAFVGHGPHTCEALRLPLLLWDMTGEAKYKEAFQNALIKLFKNLELSGSCKSDEFIGTFQSALVMEDASRTTVLSGSLPLPTTGFEFCSTVELTMDYLMMEEIQGDLSLSDKLEWLVYNAGFASRHPGGKMIQYLGADNMYDASQAVNPRFDYSPTHEDAAGCCCANCGRMIPAFSEMAFVEAGDRLIANFYMPLEFTYRKADAELKFAEETHYPFDETVRFSVSGKGAVDFALRVPAWSKTPELKVNGKKAAVHIEDGLLLLPHKLSHKDTVEVTFIPQIIQKKAPDGSVAVARGPLMYSYEIPSVKKVRRKYSYGKGFADCDFVPREHENWDFVLMTDKKGALAESSFTKATLDETKAYPLEKGYPTITVKALNRYAYPTELCLKPIGATTLRRSAFFTLYDQNGVYSK